MSFASLWIRFLVDTGISDRLRSANDTVTWLTLAFAAISLCVTRSILNKESSKAIAGSKLECDKKQAVLTNA